jgi:protoheme IX farnesyltransferase
MESALYAPPSLRSVLRAYLQLMKLPIVALLVITCVTAMFVAAGGVPDLGTLMLTMLGGALSSGGASALNQYWDRDMDGRMARTARRPIPSGRVSPANALVFGLALVAWSVFVLSFVNWLAALLALGGAIYYVVIYTMLLKRNTVVNILIGGGAGAMPVLVGWAAVTGTLTFEPFILFLIVFYWTPPHSWALALLVNQDYSRVGVPMMPVARGEDATRHQILLYSIQLFLITLLPVFFGTLGGVYLAGVLLLGGGMIYMAARLIRQHDKAFTRATYKYTTLYLAVLFMIIIFDRVLL